MAVESMGQVYCVHTREAIQHLTRPFELMSIWPCTYGKDGSPRSYSDYCVIVYVRSDNYSMTDVMDALKGYGPTSARWLTNFWKEV